jgi:hypothetical protein
MSSIYRLICLSHDPGLELETEWQSGSDGRRIAETVLRTISTDYATEELAQHAHCDLVIGRYSYPIIQVGYLTHRVNPVSWIDAEWLRVLVEAVVRHGTGDQLTMPQGWTPERCRRIRHLLYS